jgi:hypothetical protein
MPGTTKSQVLCLVGRSTGLEGRSSMNLVGRDLFVDTATYVSLKYHQYPTLNRILLFSPVNQRKLEARVDEYQLHALMVEAAVWPLPAG